MHCIRSSFSLIIVFRDSELSIFLLYDEVQQVAENIDVCVEDETVNYLNRKDVQHALHARLVGVNRWLVCSK